MVTVLGVEANRITAKIRVKHRDQRDAPRLYAGMELRYRVQGPDSPSAEAWLAGAEAENTFAPDPYMNFSMTGLQFEDQPHCQANDLLLFSLKVGRDPRTFRGTGRVVRVAPIPREEREEGSTASHRIAMTFLELPDACRQALVEQTGRIHDGLAAGSNADDP